MAGINRLLAALTAALWIGAACKRAPDAASEAPVPELAAPAPSSTFVSTPLDTASTGYTNEMQAENLRKEAAEMEGPPQGPPPPLSKAEVRERRRRLRELTRELERMRRGMEGGRDKSVTLPGDTVSPIPGQAPDGALDSRP